MSKHPHRKLRLARLAAAGVVAALTGSALAACTGADSSQSGEIVITCIVCAPSPEDPTLQYVNDLVQRFNDEFDGQYQIDIIETANVTGTERLQEYQQLALAGDLPDIVEVNPRESAVLSETGALLDFTPIVDADPEWAATFYPDAFGAHEGPDGQLWAIPSQRDSIGIYYNKDIFAAAGVDFPTTWSEMLDACAAIERIGKLCWSLSGGFITQLLVADLIGTQDGGPEFLEGGIQDLDYANDDRFAKAIDYVRDLRDSGYVNTDSVADDTPTYIAAAGLFLTGESAMFPNGPWFISDLTKDPAAADFADKVGYAPSPGWTEDGRGVIVLSGEGAWASGSTDPDKIEAVTAFMKFATSRAEVIEKIRATNSFSPVEVDFTGEEASKLPTLAVGLTEESADLPYIFRHVSYAAPAGFDAAWSNLWPSFVNGELTTQEFLSRLAEDAPGLGN